MIAHTVIAIASTGGTPLHYAARVSNGYVAELLLKEGADLKAKDSDRLTPIYQASFFGHDQIVKLLLQYYAPEPKKKSKTKKAIRESTSCDNIQVGRTLLIPHPIGRP
jgi:ankyrin repeat protein